MGKGKFALPHEDEWEYACRGGKGNKQAFYFGDELNGKQANCNGNIRMGQRLRARTWDEQRRWAATRRSAPHPWGLCDMSGNVCQWCENKYDNQDDRRIWRGSSWYNDAMGCRCADRTFLAAHSRFQSDYRNNWIGFRVAVLP